MINEKIEKMKRSIAIMFVGGFNETEMEFDFRAIVMMRIDFWEEKIRIWEIFIIYCHFWNSIYFC